MISRISERMGVHWGTRGEKQGGRPFVFDQTIDQRAKFNSTVAAYAVAEGDQVLSDGKPAVLTRLVAGGGCVVTFSKDGCNEEVSSRTSSR